MAPPGTNIETKAALSVVPTPRKRPGPDVHRLTSALQTTLELEEVLKIFAREVGKSVPIDSLSYKNDALGLNIATARPSHHSGTYKLTLKGENLGEVVFSRGRKFTEDEFTSLEFLLCSLVYPLRNALRYNDAVSASRRDPLTAAGNRAALAETLEREVRLAQRNRAPLALIAVDIDFFKRINDNYGHAVGDSILKAVSARLREATRSSDMLFRYGGEEFVSLLPQTDREGAEHVAQRIRHAIAGHECGPDCPYANQGLHVTVSVGISLLEDGDDGRSLFDKADRALYRAKRDGRNRAILYDAAQEG